MGSPYTPQSAASYNANPPPDDGSENTSNRVTWAGIKTKLADPVKTLADGIDDEVASAFGKVIGGAGIVSTAIDYGASASDQGKLIKVTAADKTVTTPDATSVGTRFVFATVNISTGDLTVDGSGSQTIDGDASITVPSGSGAIFETDGTNWFTYGKAARTQITPQGYLTLVSGEVVATSDQSAKTAVYYTPDVGNLVPVPDGTKFITRSFSELTLTLSSSHVANAIYDIFLFNDSGTLRIGTGPSWVTATAGSGARGTGAGTTELVKLAGLWTNKVSITARNGSSTYSVAASAGLFLGSIVMDGTNGQISQHVTYGQSRRPGPSNAYNRKLRVLKCGDSTSSWTYGTNTIRASNNSSANSLTIFSCLIEEPFRLVFTQNMLVGVNASIDGTSTIGIGFNSTSAYSGKKSEIRFSNSNAGGVGGRWDQVATYLAPPSKGINTVTCLEQFSSTGGTTISGTYSGTEAYMLLSAEWMA